MPSLLDVLRSIHLMDIVLFLIIIGFAFLGFTRGTVKVFIILASIYFGFVVAAIYYLPMATLVHTALNVSLSKVAEIIAFLFLNVVVAVLFTVLMFQFFGHIEIQGRMGACIDRPIGMLLGFVTGIAVAAILVILLEVPYELFDELQLAGAQAPAFKILHDWYQDSVLAGTLIKGLPLLEASVAPLLNGHNPPIFVKPGAAGLLPSGLAWLMLRFG